MSGGPVFTTVESPFIDQLGDMGWKFVIGNLDGPSVTGRETFREVLIKSALRKPARSRPGDADASNLICAGGWSRRFNDSRARSVWTSK